VLLFAATPVVAVRRRLEADVRPVPRHARRSQTRARAAWATLTQPLDSLLIATNVVATLAFFSIACISGSNAGSSSDRRRPDLAPVLRDPCCTRKGGPCSFPALL
jgi:hypothetical protein